MGLNAFFVYTVCIGFGLSYINAPVLVFLESMIFILLTVTGLRKKIFDSLPAAYGLLSPRVSVCSLPFWDFRMPVLL